LLSDPVIVGIATKHEKTAAQVVIRWHLVSIPKTVRRERLRENIEAVEFRLDDEDMRRIDGLDSPDGRIGPNPATATFRSEHFCPRQHRISAVRSSTFETMRADQSPSRLRLGTTKSAS
jgi:hypothetical protein